MLALKLSSKTPALAKAEEVGGRGGGRKGGIYLGNTKCYCLKYYQSHLPI